MCQTKRYGKGRFANRGILFNKKERKKERNGLDIQAKRELPVLTQTDKSSTWKMKWKCRDSYSE